ncbi:DUF2946 domain-containing protein [Burkholderia sp. WAC0059]|uniref:DUF2946 domain-containing protein n=1 Tax=Burkholderia sp. WAC0059 TaxID=2066022 RepID=UPI000C7F6D24|nr:DUF2946 domain-containing protein [Burkholderia sp. WAC0059]PLZ03463.1 DUF2946 domain-containing protein [Burkholderia sp. WAC0059]
MSLRARNRLTAWLGLVAMGLVMLAPLASQAAARRDDAFDAPLCGGAVQSADGGRAPTHGDPFAACGYCDLLASHAAMPTLPPALPAPGNRVTKAAGPVPFARFIPPRAFPSGRQRAPPSYF